MSVAVASLGIALFAGTARGEPPPLSDRAHPVLGLSVRNGDYLALEPAFLFQLGAPGESRRPIAAFVRGEVGVGGAGGGFGLAVDWFESKPYPNVEEFFYGGLMTMETRIERMYGRSNWGHTTYVGSQLSFNLMWKLSLGWMANVHDGSDQHVQIGLGAGF